MFVAQKYDSPLLQFFFATVVVITIPVCPLKVREERNEHAHTDIVCPLISVSAEVMSFFAFAPNAFGQSLFAGMLDPTLVYISLSVCLSTIEVSFFALSISELKKGLL